MSSRLAWYLPNHVLSGRSYEDGVTQRVRWKKDLVCNQSGKPPVNGSQRVAGGGDVTRGYDSSAALIDGWD